MNAILTLLEGQPPMTSREIARRLEVSQPTVSRALSRAGDRVVRIGRGRATRYALAGRVFSEALAVPLFLVDEKGLVSRVASLRALTTGHYVVDEPDAPLWLLGDSKTGLFDSLPYFIYDLRPAGFMGRQIARRFGSIWGFSEDPRNWGDSHIGQYLLRQGTDVAGNLVVGEAAANRVHSVSVASVEDRIVDYPRLAEDALADGLPGSSAAGEQPKFAAYQPTIGHVIVKFSPAGPTAEAQRWRDLLRAEGYALAALADHDVPAAQTDVHAIAGRVFLESQRFDRQGVQGRWPALSLAVVDAEFAGVGRGWTRVSEQLCRQGLLDQHSVDRLVWAEAFGAWVGNTDMHLGNVSLAPTDSGFRLLPLYDMLPMAFAPVRGELREVALPPPIRNGAHEEAWLTAGQAATAYWLQLADDGALSDDFRQIAHSQGSRLRKLLGPTGT